MQSRLLLEFGFAYSSTAEHHHTSEQSNMAHYTSAMCLYGFASFLTTKIFLNRNTWQCSGPSTSLSLKFSNRYMRSLNQASNATGNQPLDAYCSTLFMTSDLHPKVSVVTFINKRF
jgi:hypothetical protein